MTRRAHLARLYRETRSKGAVNHEKSLHFNSGECIKGDGSEAATNEPQTLDITQLDRSRAMPVGVTISPQGDSANTFQSIGTLARRLVEKARVKE